MYVYVVHTSLYPSTVVLYVDEPLPPEQKALLKWKMSPITPNILKTCINRVGFTRLKSEIE